VVSELVRPFASETNNAAVSVLGGNRVSARTALQRVEDEHSANTRARTGFFWRRH
jgi:hypothetical protein